MTPAFRKGIACSTLVLLGVLLYCYTLPFPFVYDDYIYLTGNPFIQTARSFAYPFHFKQFANEAARIGLDPDLSANFILRPVTYLTFHLNFLWDGLNPRGFRAVNIAIHCANALLVYFLLIRLLALGKGPVPASSPGFIAFFSALLFVVHPLQIESVTYVVQRFTSLATFFYLATLFCYFTAIQQPRQGGAWRWAAILCLLAGMLSKEDVFTAPFLLVILDRVVLNTPWKAACRRAFPFFCLLPLVPLLLMAISWATKDGSLTGALNVANSVDRPISQYQYLLTQLSVILFYLRLLVLPLKLNIDWDYPLSTSLLEPRVLLSLCMILALLGSAWVFWRKNPKDSRWGLLFISVLWFFFTIAPSSSIAPLPDLVAEHRSYLPSVGALVALVCLGDLFRTSRYCATDLRAAFPILLAAWVAMLCLATINRNSDWRSNVVLLEDVTRQSPLRFRGWVNLAAAYYEEGRFLPAIASLEKVILLEPKRVATYGDLAKACLQTGAYQKGLDASRAGLSRAPGDPQLLYQLALCQWSMGQRIESLAGLHRLVQSHPGFTQARQALEQLTAQSAQR